MHQVQAAAGDCIFIEAGTVHALGEGTLVAEIQQSSDTTYRLFDWNRLGADGKPRPLHVEQGLEAIDYERGPVNPRPLQATDRPTVGRVVACDKFVLDRWDFETPQTVGGDDRCHIVCVLEGEIAVEGDPTGKPVARGSTVLLPAGLGTTRLVPHEPTVLLDAYLP